MPSYVAAEDLAGERIVYVKEPGVIEKIDHWLEVHPKTRRVAVVSGKIALFVIQIGGNVGNIIRW